MNLSAKYRVFLILFYFGTKGIAYSALLYGITPLIISVIRGTAEELQFATVVMALPWATKAIFAAVSDSFPIGLPQGLRSSFKLVSTKYHKRWYISGWLLVLTACLIVLAGVERGDPISVTFVAVSVASLATSSADILAEGSWAESICFNKSGKSEQVSSFVWGLCSSGMGVGAVLVGLVAQHDPKIFVLMFGATAVFPLAAAVLVAACDDVIPNDEEIKHRVPDLAVPLKTDDDGDDKQNEDNRESTVAAAAASSKLSTADWALSVLLLLACVALIGLGISFFRAVQKSSGAATSAAILTIFVVIFIIGVVCISVVFALGLDRSPLIPVTVYWLISEAVAVSVNSVVDYYFLANDDCVLNGPAFSYR